MSAQHTPWTYTRNPENSRWIIDSEPHHAIACTAGYACDDEGVARLIAAAPELLDALREARTSLSITRTNIICEIGRCADPNESRWAGVPELLKKRIDDIDAAIAKTTGAA